MKLHSTELEIEHRGSSVVLTVECGGKYEAILMYESLIDAARTGKIKLTLGTGAILEEEPIISRSRLSLRAQILIGGLGAAFGLAFFVRFGG